MAALPVSVCIIAKNEERYIEQCLKHLLPYEMELIVVDTGSTDATKEIARKYTDNVYDFVWTDDFSAARNYAASKASHNWILVLDCDEYLIELDTRMLRVCMQQHLRHVGMLKLRNLYTKEDETKAYHIDKVPRFYNKNFFEYRFRIHEQITPLNQEKLEEVRLLTYELPLEAEHHGYDISKEEMQKKQERNLELLKSSIGETPFDDYLYFQIGQSYYVLEEYELAAKAYHQSFDLLDNLEKGFVKNAIISYTKTLHKLKRYEEQIKLQISYEHIMQSAEFSYYLGCAFFEKGEYLKALLTFVKITQMRDFESLGELAYDTYVKIMLLHGMSGNQEGVEYFKKRLEEYGLAHGRQIVIY